MKNNALKIHQADNVAIATRPVKKGEAVIAGGQTLVSAAQDVDPSHKIALLEIKAGCPVIRYGEPIVVATIDIHKGQWVHVHNTQPIDGTAATGK
jgi:altronate hydrolase